MIQRESGEGERGSEEDVGGEKLEREADKEQ
jgi:hypothetical protein